jgi:glutamate racemase
VTKQTAGIDDRLFRAATLEPVLDSPIGIFDSSFGGLTVARAVLDQLPHESVLYLGDTARQPYGPRPIAEVRRFSLECLDHLVDHGVKALVIACNSASAAMLHDARERYEVPVLEVIRPAVRRAVAATRNNKVGVISTQSTHQSQAYADLFAAAPQITVTSRPCPRFVGFVESGVTSGDELLAVARSYLAPIVAQGVDTLILGCTHYPLLTGVISYVMGEDVTLVSSAEETAKDVFRVLTDARKLRPADLPGPVHEFLTTGDPLEFERLARRFLGPEVVRASAEPVAAAR